MASPILILPTSQTVTIWRIWLRLQIIWRLPRLSLKWQSRKSVQITAINLKSWGWLINQLVLQESSRIKFKDSEHLKKTNTFSKTATKACSTELRLSNTRTSATRRHQHTQTLSCTEHISIWMMQAQTRRKRMASTKDRVWVRSITKKKRSKVLSQVMKIL